MSGQRDRQVVCVSTRNLHKLEELSALMAPLSLRVVAAAELGVPEVDETGDTFAANALLKAAAAYEKTGLACLADDSGLAVDALGGAPGVHSARFAGPGAADADNNRLLLAQLAGRPPSERGAAFHCALALLVPAAQAKPLAHAAVDAPGVPPGAAYFAIAGSVRGEILTEARGGAGFGYDPYFLHPPSGKTFAELDGAAKNLVSHRARAFASLRATLAELWPR
ncbi:MAG: non-canonical purine NTP pyrophosphatase [Myxococcota bacterium]